MILFFSIIYFVLLTIFSTLRDTFLSLLISRGIIKNSKIYSSTSDGIDFINILYYGKNISFMECCVFYFKKCSNTLKRELK